MTLQVDWSSLSEVSAYADRKAQRDGRAYIVVQGFIGRYTIEEPDFRPEGEIIYHRAEYKSPYD